MKISIIPNAFSQMSNRLFTDTSVRDDVFVSYRAIKKAAEEKGWLMATFDQIPIKEADKVLAFNFISFPEAILTALEIIGRSNMVAVVREPPGINSIYYDRDIQHCFGQYYTPQNNMLDNQTSFYLGFPVSPIDTAWVPFEKRKLLVSISGGKFLIFKGSLYRERIKAIKHFQASIPEEFDMYGEGWERTSFFSYFSIYKLFSCYKGRVPSKYATMQQYKFSLCYENSSNVCGYISEKIFDSMQCGCVPIYLGAPDIEKYIPKTCFIDRRKFGSDREVEQFILSIGKERHSGYLKEIRQYLNSEPYLERLPDRYAKKIISFLENEIKMDSNFSFVDGQRKIKVLTAMKKISHGNFFDKHKGMMLFLKHGKLYDWVKLIKMIVEFVIQKTGIADIITWIRVWRI